MSAKENNFIKGSYSKVLKTFFEPSGTKYLPDYSSAIKEYKSKSKLKSSTFFYDLVAGDKNLFWCEDKKKPLIGYFCNLVPEEIILAFNAIPIRLCSADTYCAKAGEEIVPGDICPIIKSVCGSLFSKKYDQLDLLVIPAACDSKIKLAEILSPFKEVYFLDIPRESSYLKNVEVWTQKYSQFYKFLKERFNSKITRKELLKACEITNKRTDIFRKIYSFRAKNPNIINSFDYFLMAYTSFFSDPAVWTEKAEKIYSEALEMESKSLSVFNGKRILLTGAPVIFPNFKILKILEELGCDLSADTLCSAYGKMYDPVEIDEETEIGIIRTLSLKYIAASICPCFLGIDKLIDLLIDTVRKYKLNGVIYHNLRLCHVFEIQTLIIRQILKKNKIPFLSLKTDLGKEDTGQVKTRIEAFLEMLR